MNYILEWPLSAVGVFVMPHTHRLVSWTGHWAPLAGAKVGPNCTMKSILVAPCLCQDALYIMNHTPDPSYVNAFPLRSFNEVHKMNA